MDEGFSAPPAIELNFKEEDKNINSLTPEFASEEEQKMKDELNYVTIENNNKENEEETKHEEQEVEEKQRPLVGDINNEIGTKRKVLQCIAIFFLYAFALWELILQILYGFSYEFIDVVILTAFATFMLIFTIKKRSTGGCKFGLITFAVTFLGLIPIGLNMAHTEFNNMFIIFLCVRTGVMFIFICSLNLDNDFLDNLLILFSNIIFS